MSGVSRHRINAAICLLVLVHAIYRFVSGNLEPGSITFDIARELVDQWTDATEDELRLALREIVLREHLVAEDREPSPKRPHPPFTASLSRRHRPRPSPPPRRRPTPSRARPVGGHDASATANRREAF